MIVCTLVYCAGMFFLLRHLDHRMQASQRRREALHFQRSTGFLV